MRFLTLAILSLLLVTCSSGCGDRKVYALPGKLFIEVEQLDSALQSQVLTVIDFRQQAEYKAGHVPGAVNFWRRDIDLVGQDSTRGSITREQLAQLLGAKGVASDRSVIVYDDGELVNASKFAWLMQACGMQDVHILLGGLPRWKQRGLAVESEEPPSKPSHFTFPSGQPETAIASSEDVFHAIADTHSIIVDVRDWSEHSGAEKRGHAARAGSIPNGIWLEYTDLLHNVEGVLRPKSHEEMRSILLAKGITPDKRILPYCQSGYRSACFCLLLNRELGYPHVMNYAGSWLDWAAQPSLPVESIQLESQTLTIP